MLSDDLRLAMHAFDHVVIEIMERECRWMDVAAARVVRNNLADILARLEEWERAASPIPPSATDLPDNVVRFARKCIGLPTDPTGGDAA